LEEIFQNARPADDILLIGRTHYGILREDIQLIREALKKGVNLKILLLDHEALAKLGPEHVDLRSLRLKDAHFRLTRDLHEAESMLKALRDHCLQRRVDSSVLVHRTDVLIQSSVLVHVPREQHQTMR